MTATIPVLAAILISGVAVFAVSQMLALMEREENGQRFAEVLASFYGRLDLAIKADFTAALQAVSATAANAARAFAELWDANQANDARG